MDKWVLDITPKEILLCVPCDNALPVGLVVGIFAEDWHGYYRIKTKDDGVITEHGQQTDYALEKVVCVSEQEKDPR